MPVLAAMRGADCMAGAEGALVGRFDGGPRSQLTDVIGGDGPFARESRMICGCLGCTELADVVVRHPEHGNLVVCEWHAQDFEVLRGVDAGPPDEWPVEQTALDGGRPSGQARLDGGLSKDGGSR